VIAAAFRSPQSTAITMKPYAPLGITLLLFAFAATGRAQTPLVEYLFNETGTSASSSSGATASLLMGNSADQTTDLHSFDSAGASGTAGDRAFDNTASTGMGKNFAGGYARGSTTLSVSQLSAFTLTGWFKTDTSETLGNISYLMSYYDFGSNTGFSLSSSTNGILTLTVNGTAYASSGSANYSLSGQWVFFAVTYDQSSVRFYVGTDNAATLTITADATRTVSSGSVVDTSGKVLTIGNTSAVGSQRPFDGLIDDVRIFDSSLTKSQIETFRTSDLTSSIPEPSSYSLILGALALAFPAVIRPRKR
jgi:hypothetical protein